MQLLIALIALDLHYRWPAAEPIDSQWYLARFPELVGPATEISQEFITTWIDSTADRFEKAWSPDGSTLAYCARDSQGIWFLWKVKLEGSVHTQLVPGLFPHQDEVEAIRGVPERGQQEDARIPAGRVGQPRELGWAATFLASPYAAYVTGHTLVVDGANWQRRAMLMPEFVPIREQLGRGPFEP